LKRTTGYYQHGLGADYMLENDALLAHPGNNSNFQNQFILVPNATVTFSNSVSTGKMFVANWTVDKAAINLPGCDATIDVFFEVTNAVDEAFSTKHPAQYKYACSAATVSSTPPANTPRASTPTITASPATTVRIGVPAYFNPSPNCKVECYWAQLEQAEALPSTVVINPNSGAGIKQDSDYLGIAIRLKQKGVRVIGYIKTEYGARSSASIEADLDLYFNWYDVDGIFVDEVKADTCGDNQTYYYQIANYIRHKKLLAVVVLNPGTNADSCFITFSDILVTFEGSFADYKHWSPSGWEAKFPADRFWHIIHSTSQNDLPNALNLARKNHVGWVYITSDVMPNPYDTLPALNYWKVELSLVK